MDFDVNMVTERCGHVLVFLFSLLSGVVMSLGGKFRVRKLGEIRAFFFFLDGEF